MLQAVCLYKDQEKSVGVQNGIEKDRACACMDEYVDIQTKYVSALATVGWHTYITACKKLAPVSSSSGFDGNVPYAIRLLDSVAKMVIIGRFWRRLQTVPR